MSQYRKTPREHEEKERRIYVLENIHCGDADELGKRGQCPEMLCVISNFCSLSRIGLVYIFSCTMINF